MTTELATAHSTTLALAADQTFFTPQQVSALEHIGVEGASEGDLGVFFHVAKRTGLDPFARQIHMIGRMSSENVGGEWVKTKKWTIQTGIDGFRLIGRRAADATGDTISLDPPKWAHAEQGWQEIWVGAWGTPVAARVTLHRNGQAFTAVALFDEYKQTKRDGTLTSMWAQRPAGQLAKCAEALAWRMAFPQDLSGIYADEEMGGANSHTAQAERPQSGLGAALAAEQHVDTTTGEIVEPPADDTLTDRTRAHMFVLFAKKGIAEVDQLSGVNHINGTAHTSRSQITESEAQAVIAVLEKKPDVDEGPVDAELVEES